MISLLLLINCTQPTSSSGGGSGASGDRGDSIVSVKDVSIDNSSTSSTLLSPILSPRNGYPGDFPELIDEGGFGIGKALFGFGGNTSKDQAGNRAAIKHIPVILLHGNGTDVNGNKFGMQTLKNFLISAGYNDSEIWAVSYLGANPSFADLNNPHCNNINDVRKFIDAVITYLGVEKVAIIGHSLGAGMARAYLFGLIKGSSYTGYSSLLSRYYNVAALITLAGGNYGLGDNSSNEFQTGSPFEKATHKIPGTGIEIYDDTPYGASIVKSGNTVAERSLPDNRSYNNGKFGGTSSADNGANRIFYGGITALNDFVDAKLKDTGYLQGADVNKEFDLGTGLTGHEQVIKDQEVFYQAILPVLQTADNYYRFIKIKCLNNKEISLYINMDNGEASMYFMKNYVIKMSTKYLQLSGAPEDNLIELKGNGLSKIYLNKERKILYFREGTIGTFANVSIKMINKNQLDVICLDNKDIDMNIRMDKNEAVMYFMGNHMFKMCAQYQQISGAPEDNLIELIGGETNIYLNKDRKILYFRDGAVGTFADISIN